MGKAAKIDPSLRWGVATFLVILVLITAILASEKLHRVTDSTLGVTIELIPGQLTTYARSETDMGLTQAPTDTDEGGGDTSQADTNDTASAPVTQTAQASTQTYTTELNPSFYASDSDQAWESSTQVNIFRPTTAYSTYRRTAAYGPGDGEASPLADDSQTVEAQVTGDGEAIVAPGSSNTYTFWLNNSGDTAVDYTLEASCWFGSEAYTIPIVIKLANEAGTYLLGSEDEWVPIAQLNELLDSGVLSSAEKTSYTLEWQWPFDDDDSRDTDLGMMAQEDDLTLTVAIRTTAAAEDSVTTTRTVWGLGVPKTGDAAHPEWWVLICAVCFVGTALTIKYAHSNRRRKP